MEIFNLLENNNDNDEEYIIKNLETNIIPMTDEIFDPKIINFFISKHFNKLTIFLLSRSNLDEEIKWRLYKQTISKKILENKINVLIEYIKSFDQFIPSRLRQNFIALNLTLDNIQAIQKEIGFFLKMAYYSKIFCYIM